jgi:hypothetical protein
VYQAVPGAAGNGKERDLTDFHTKPLDKVTWPDFARLAEKHNGVWSGCWCMAFHLDGGWGKRTAAQNRSEKEQRVMDGNAHAALVYDGAIPVGWCQFGPTAELPRIKNRRAYEAGLTDLPDWRITCFSWIGTGGTKESRPPASGARWAKSPGSAAAPWRATPKMLSIGRSPVRSCTTEPLPCSSVKGSRDPAVWARTTG